MSTSQILSSDETAKVFEKFVIPNYGRYPVSLVRGEGSLVWDSEGNRYLDLFPGWGCNLLGHCPGPIVQAIQDQVATLIHVPNTWYIESQGRWAQLLSERSFAGQAFFCNSGAEANEAAIKLARLHHGPDRYKIITFEGGFHGRSLATTTATAQPRYQEGLGPLMAGFQYAPFGDADAVAELIDDQTSAILVEPIQGEGGIRISPEDFLPRLRQLADENDLLLMFDEVQTGCGRTGQWFGYQHFGVIPDVMTLAKSVCGGIAGGAMLTNPELAKSLRPGMHASTFGGNPIAARAGIAAIEMIEQDGLLAQSQKTSAHCLERLTEMANALDVVKEVRVLGMMIGIELLVDGGPVVQKCLARGVLINCTQQTVVRLLPALNVPLDVIDEGLDVLGDVLLELTD